MSARPRITVAAVLERDGKYLFVEERIREHTVLNQPAGHVEGNETLTDAVMREILEETAWSFTPTHLIGIYCWTNPQLNHTYVRFCFTGQLLTHDPQRHLDTGILRTVWYSLDELHNSPIPLRSPLVMRCIADYRAGQRYGLDLITDVP